MNDILDVLIEKPVIDRVYLKKSVQICWIYLVAIVLFIGLAVLENGNDSLTDIITMIDALVFLVLMVASPLGVYYSRKSKRMGEGNSQKRLVLAIVHWFMFMTLLLFFLGFAIDLTATYSITSV